RRRRRRRPDPARRHADLRGGAAGDRHMRHPVSTLRGGERGGGAVAAEVVGGPVLPAAPQNSDPGTREDANGVRMVAAAADSSLVPGGGPRGGMPGIIGEGRERRAQAFIAGPAECDAVMLTGGVSDGSDAGLGGQVLGTAKAAALIAELGQDLSGVDGAAARQALPDGGAGGGCGGGDSG